MVHSIWLIVTAQEASTPAHDAARQYFSDTVLTDHEGQRRRFYTDVLEDNVVVLHSFFGDCTGICPMVLGKLRSLQDRLGSRLGRDVLIVSISVDPVRDAPARLNEVATKIGAKAGWIFLSGDQHNVQWVLYRLGLHTAARETHNPNLIIGSERLGNWKKLAVSADTATLLAEIDDVVMK